MGQSYGLKSNALTALAIQNGLPCGIATFSGKATYTHWDPDANGGLGGYVTTGNNLFTVYAKDCNEPGNGYDYFWVRSVGDLIMENPPSTYAIVINGGSIAVPHRAR